MPFGLFWVIMINENYWTDSLNTIFPLDTTSKKGYNGINTMQKNKGGLKNGNVSGHIQGIITAWN